ncbi:hypothetical protein SAMN06265795_116119 [Noviherbaspirillum humi]|uniref:NADAR domain-containing protein n=1 Tax=Noviherbaspirillum humi TaxID=1688639 RepID=A0A239KPQ2_9BURK|nr:NADAR family protein [Noviherbaspirillum humi]SNT19658.1 hypothetical protein SAMN06265795_116119 [Noviherbaspirillum humi]
MPMRDQPNLTFFSKNTSPFSQFFKTSFMVEGQVFNTTEQYMMFSKAKLFGDMETAEQILTTDAPKEQKALGRKVKGFDKTVWDAECRNVVFRGNYAKFSQNPKLLKHLLDTEGTQLVEASPWDTIWE